MALPYWSETDLTDRIGAESARVYLDDSNEGVIGAGPLARLQADCDSFVEGFLRGIYDLDVIRADPPNQVKRLSLDLAEARLARRKPEYKRSDWLEMEASIRQELVDIRAGKIRLDVVGSPEPGANQGGNLIAPGSDTTSGIISAPALVFGGTCGMGDF